jgi:hypothetical protein
MVTNKKRRYARETSIVNDMKNESDVHTCPNNSEYIHTLVGFEIHKPTSNEIHRCLVQKDYTWLDKRPAHVASYFESEGKSLG